MTKQLKDFTSWTPTPLREEVFLTLKKAIISGDLKKGERLIETEISDAMGLSRTPVREALRMLELDGLVRRVPRSGGVEVVGFTIDDIIEIFSIRASLEKLAISYSIMNITEDEIHQLEQLQESSELYESRNDRESLFEVLNDFNKLLLHSCKMPRLIANVEKYHEYLRFFRKNSMLKADRIRTAVREHGEIIACLRKKDFECAHHIMREHLTGSLCSYLKSIGKYDSLHGKMPIWY